MQQLFVVYDLQMLSVAERTEVGTIRRMSDETLSAREAEQRLMGRALKALRERQGRTQGQAGGACAPAMTSQAWQKYEAGERKFTRDTIDRLTRAVGANADGLAAERALILGEEPAPRGVSEVQQPYLVPVWGRARAGSDGPQVYDLGEPERFLDLVSLFGRNSRATTLAGESMTPWANSGSVIIYDVFSWPRRDEGCVIELSSGQMLVKLYKKTDGSTLFVEELFPERRELRFRMSDVVGVYAVTFRGS